MGNLSCDICGREDVKAVVLIEGAKMLACGGCMRGGKVLHRLTDDDEGRPAVEIKQRAPMGESREIVEGYGRIIKRARDSARLPMAVIAERVSEKESYLDAIENERIMPSFAVARKLEKELKIKLIEEVDQSVGPSTAASGQSFSEPTLADALLSQKSRK
ncbi:TPA: TIGR00270 family protein, partial [Candidatus Micrarchaeota archaeon]|nr:TIGR00270 family protein [Candidatus Micrarchaeota archaeon]